MDYAKRLHEIIDGVRAGDWHAAVAALSLLIATLGMAWLSARASSYASKQGWRLFKWAITPKPLGELAQFLLAALNKEDTLLFNGVNVKCGDRIYFWCDRGSDFSKILFYPSGKCAQPFISEDVLPLLSRRERRHVLKMARWRRACLHAVFNRNAALQEQIRRSKVVSEVLSSDKEQNKEETSPIHISRSAPIVPCACMLETGDTCDTCIGADVSDQAVAAPGRPTRDGCNCIDCRQWRDMRRKLT